MNIKLMHYFEHVICNIWAFHADLCQFKYTDVYLIFKIDYISQMLYFSHIPMNMCIIGLFFLRSSF